MGNWVKRLLAVAAAAAAFAATGCVSINTLQSANTLGAGKSEFAVEPCYEGIGYKDGFDNAQSLGVPRFDIAYRYGISDTVDIGGRFGSSGIEVMGKFQLTPPGERDLIMSLAPSIGGFAAVGGDGSAGIVNISVPLLLGLGTTENGSQFVLGPKLVDVLVFASDSGGSSGTGNRLLIGTTIGYVAKMGTFKLVPEFGILYPLVSSAKVSTTNGESVSGSSAFGSGLVYQFGLGLVFGS